MLRNAIIMAGGEGQRLRPLTEHRPKPLMPLLDEPVIGMTLRLLRRHGISEATLTLCYRADDIMHALGDGSTYGVSLRYAVEDTPRGTAGSVKDAAQKMRGTVLVLSGDGLTDADLTTLYEIHKKHGAYISMVVKRVEDATGYGVCEISRNGRISAFLEKPERPPAGSLVNTGIYFLEAEVLAHIPDAGTYDFGQDLLPELMSKGITVQALETDAYWCDIGSREAYARAQLDMLTGQVGLPVHGHRVGAAIVGRNCHVARDVRIAGRCYIGDHVRVERGTVLGEGTVILPGTVVGPSVHLENACLWENAAIDGGTILKNVVVMPQGGNRSLQRIVPYHAQ